MTSLNALIHTLPYSVLYRLKRGRSISVSLTFHCNLACPYCTMLIPDGKRHRVPVSSFEQWRDFFEQYPVKLKEVFISGGEPTLIHHCNQLIRYLIRRRILVAVFTNLTTPTLSYLKPSPYLRINASYHGTLESAFLNRVHRLRRMGHQVTIDEVGTKRLPIHTPAKNKITTAQELLDDDTQFRHAPDSREHRNCYDLYEYGR